MQPEANGSSASATAVPVAATDETCTIPRCDDLALNGGAEAWGSCGFRVNVLQDVDDLPSGADGVPARAFLAWSKDSFLLRVEVDTTETHEQESELWLGDCVELFFSAGADLRQNSQVIVAPGIDPDHPAKNEMIFTTPDASPKPFPVKTTAQRTPSGYAVEFSLPWNAFGVVPEIGQKCAIQIMVDHRGSDRLHHTAWYPDAHPTDDPTKRIALVLGENPSPAVDSLARAMALGPREGQVAFTIAPDAMFGHAFTVQYQDKVLYRHEITGGASSLVDFFPLPAEWSDSEPVVVRDNEKVLATLTRDDALVQIKSLGFNLAYGFGSAVFAEKEFPAGSFLEDAVVRHYFAPVKVSTTFYDAQYNEVKRAEKPGRYGAIVQIHLGNGTDVTKYITLYRLPQKFNWWEGDFTVSALLSPGTGVDPAVLRTHASVIGGIIRAGFNQSRNNDLAVLLAGLSETAPGDPPVARLNGAAKDAEWWYGLRQHLNMVETYPYVVDLPAGYDSDPNKKWPLILFLHGLGGGMQVRKNGLPKLMAQGKQLPAIVISPEAPGYDWWKTVVLSHFLDEISAKYRIDQDRICVTGFSMGGFGSWSLALAYPDRFAAIAPISGGGDPPDAARLIHLPIWTFHGLKDPVVSPALDIDMVNAVRKAGGHPHFTTYPDGIHSCTEAYDTEALYTWLLAQKRGQPEVKTAGLETP